MRKSVAMVVVVGAVFALAARSARTQLAMEETQKN